MSLTDEQLVLQIQKGDKKAFAEIVKRHSTKYYKFAYQYLYSKQEAEDIVQTAFLKLWERPDQWRPHKDIKFNTWFYRLIINLVLDRNKKKLPQLLGEFLLQFVYGNEREDNDETQELKNKLIASINRLPKRQQIALKLCFYQGFTHAEAAKIMETSESAVQALNIRAKNKLSKLLLNK